MNSETIGYLIIQGLAYAFIIAWHERAERGKIMSRFGSYCKKCRCFVENIESEEVRQGMYKQNELCFAGMNVYDCGECRFFLDVNEPINNIVREIGLRGHEKAADTKTSRKDSTAAKHLGGNPNA